MRLNGKAVVGLESWRFNSKSLTYGDADVLCLTLIWVRSGQVQSFAKEAVRERISEEQINRWIPIS